MTYGSDWDPPDEVHDSTRKYVDEDGRFLKPSGKWICISFRQPRFVVPRLSRPAVWETAVERLKDESAGFEYFAYIMTKISLLG
jgi:hypothetical protein